MRRQASHLLLCRVSESKETGRAWNPALQPSDLHLGIRPGQFHTWGFMPWPWPPANSKPALCFVSLQLAGNSSGSNQLTKQALDERPGEGKPQVGGRDNVSGQSISPKKGPWLFLNYKNSMGFYSQRDFFTASQKQRRNQCSACHIAKSVFISVRIYQRNRFKTRYINM